MRIPSGSRRMEFAIVDRDILSGQYLDAVVPGGGNALNQRLASDAS